MMVLFCHLVLAFYPQFDKQSLAMLMHYTSSTTTAYIIQAFVNVIFDGSLAVYIFWFMSGYVISIPLFKNPDHQIVLNAFVKRYFRLALPALASVLIAYVLLKLNAMHHLQVDAFLNHANENWIALFYNFEPDLLLAVKGALWDAFFDYHEASAYNASLWTMNQELYGSFLCYFLFATFRQHPKRFLVYASVGCFLFALNHFALVTFLAGFILCDMDYNQHVLSDIKHKLESYFFSKWYLVWPALLGMLYFAGKKIHVDLRDAFSSIVLVYILINYHPFKKFFEHKLCVWFGKLSFSVYLLHLPIISSFSSYLFLQLPYNMGTKAALTAAISIPFILVVSVLFNRLVDQKSIQFSHYLAQLFNANKNKDA